MKFMKFSAAMLFVVALGACDRLPGASQNPNDGGAGFGDASNPSTVAYFNQAVGDRVLFVVDQSTLTPEAISILNGQANWLLEYTQYSATIEGHADEQGTRAYNLALGARRASAVRDHLVSRGVADNRVDTVTYGKERPIEICSEEICWSKNRRAVTVLAGGLSS